MKNQLASTENKITIANLFDRDTILHLRIPFSLFLMPIFLFGISQAPGVNLHNTILIFFALHLFIYPGSNVYNSYMDRDTGSIGGLEKPPPVTKKLFYASIIADTIGLILCLFISLPLTGLMLLYMLASKAYSWHGIRFKKYAIGGWMIVMVFQGGFTFMLANMAASGVFGAEWFSQKNLECMVFASLIIGGSYPLTQIYQHKEDSERGDKTISYLLGIKGTFLFTALFFTLGTGVAFHFFNRYYGIIHFALFIVCTIPVVSYFFNWFRLAIKNSAAADFRHTMQMNKISSVCMIVYFLLLLFLNHMVSGEL